MAQNLLVLQNNTFLESGFIGYEMYQEDKEFKDGEGIVLKGVDNTMLG